MDIRGYFARKRGFEETEAQEKKAENEEKSREEKTRKDEQPETSKKKQRTPSEKQKKYREKLGFKIEWQQKHMWVIYDAEKDGMLCKVCQQYGKPPPQARGAWVSRGINDWSRATEDLRVHEHSNWHTEATEKKLMAEQAERHGNVIQQHEEGARQRDLVEQETNRVILKKLTEMCVFHYTQQNCTQHYLQRSCPTSYVMWFRRSSRIR